MCIESIFNCFRWGDFFLWDDEPDLRFDRSDDEEILSNWLSCWVKIVSFSFFVVDGDVALDDNFSGKISVDCWTRPNELNNCFSLPDDVVLGDSSGHIELWLDKVDGEGVDFFGAFGEGGEDWREFEFELSRS